MPRSLRIEKADGVYHIINRGNYRQDLFINEGAHLAFEKCLFEACVKCGWILEGFCVMTNHFHLVVRTPRGNLIYGMKWLQSTFANRYHKFRKVNGKLFQGRYKSLIVEEANYLGALLHYTHLNPVRGGMIDVEHLRDYRWSSYWYLQHPAKRPDFMNCASALESAGGLADSSYGRRKYEEYLRWLSADKEEQRQMAFDRMCRGWALGTKAFKKGLIAEAGNGADPEKEGTDQVKKYEGKSLLEVNELSWEMALESCLGLLGKTAKEVSASKKSADWKIMIAAVLKDKTSASNRWIAQNLEMGVPHAVSRYVGLFKEKRRGENSLYENLCAKITE